MMFHFYDKCKFSTNRQIPHFQRLSQVVLRYRIPTNQVQRTENTEFQLIKFKELKRVQSKNILFVGRSISLDY